MQKISYSLIIATENVLTLHTTLHKHNSALLEDR